MTYKMHVTQGQGGFVAAEFETLEEALKVVSEGMRRRDMSYGLEMPDGTWYDLSTIAVEPAS